MFCVVKFKSIKYIFLVVIVSTMLAIPFNGISSAQVFFGYSTKKVPIYCVDTQQKQVAISFDAAWGADKTEKIMQTVLEFNSNATFFLVGFWVDKNPDLVKKMDENGFEIGTHSNTHPDMTKLSREAAKLELQTSISMINEITGKQVELFRPPYGAYNNMLIDIAEECGVKTIQWDVDSLDWKGLSAEEITTRILNAVKCGSIILCHNNSDHIVEALPMIFDRLNKKGYKVTSVGELIYKDNYTIDRNGTQKVKI